MILLNYLSANPSLRNQSQQTPEPQQGNNILQTLLGALLGAFNENQTGEEAIVDFLIGLIPIIGQVADARDLAAYLYRIVFKQQFQDIWNWIGLALTLVGLVPVFGDLAKFLGKSKLGKDWPKLLKNAEGLLSDLRALSPEKFDDIAKLKNLLAQNWGKGVTAAQDRWNAILGQLLNWANGLPDLLFSKQKRKLIEDIQEVSGQSNKMLSQAFDRIWEEIDKALDEIGRALNPNGELVTPEGMRLPPDKVDEATQGPLRIEGGGNGSNFIPSRGFNELAQNAQTAIRSWNLSETDLQKISNLLESAKEAGDNEVARLVEQTIQRSPEAAQSQVMQFVDTLWRRQQSIPPNGFSIGNQPFRTGGQNAVFDMGENRNLLVKKSLEGRGNFNNEYRALLRMELMGIETALVKKMELNRETVLILEKIPGEISKKILDPREGQQYRHLVTQRTIDDLERIYRTLQQREVNIRDFQFMVREGDGAVIIVDPLSLQPDMPPQQAIADIIRDFKTIFNQRQGGGR